MQVHSVDPTASTWVGNGLSISHENYVQIRWMEEKKYQHRPHMTWEHAFGSYICCIESTYKSVVPCKPFKLKNAWL